MAVTTAGAPPVTRRPSWEDEESAYWAAIEHELLNPSTDDSAADAAPVEPGPPSDAWHALCAAASADDRPWADDAEELTPLASTPVRGIVEPVCDGPDWDLIAATPIYWPYAKCQRWTWRMVGLCDRKITMRRWPSQHASLELSSLAELDEDAEYDDGLSYEW